MTDFLYGQLKPNWTSNSGFETVTSNFEFITITTQVDIRTYSQAILAGQTVAQATASQNNLNKLLEVVSLRGQPVVMGLIDNSANAGATYKVILATEHAGAWSVMGTGTTVGAAGANSLLARLVADGINYGFGANLASVTSATASAVAAGTVITVASTTGVLAGGSFTGAGVVAGVVQEVISATQFIATTSQTIAGSVTLTFLPPLGAGYNDTPNSGTNSGLVVTFSTVLT